MLPQSCQVQARAGLGGDLYFVDYNGNKPQTQIQRVSVNQTHVLFEWDKISTFYTPIYWSVPG